MKKYTIQPGQQNFKPLDSFWPRFNVKKFTVLARFAPSCYYSLQDWEGDRDWYDWNKLKGVTDFFSANNSRSCMVAWRPHVSDNHIEISAYVNYPGSEIKVQPLGVIECGKIFEVTVRMRGDESEFSYSDGETETTAFLRYRRAWVSREVGTWVGGAGNAEGPYGGAATQYMELEAEVKY